MSILAYTYLNPVMDSVNKNIPPELIQQMFDRQSDMYNYILYALIAAVTIVFAVTWIKSVSVSKKAIEGIEKRVTELIKKEVYDSRIANEAKLKEFQELEFDKLEKRHTKLEAEFNLVLATMFNDINKGTDKGRTHVVSSLIRAIERYQTLEMEHNAMTLAKKLVEVLNTIENVPDFIHHLNQSREEFCEKVLNITNKLPNSQNYNELRLNFFQILDRFQKDETTEG